MCIFIVNRITTKSSPGTLLYNRITYSITRIGFRFVPLKVHTIDFRITQMIIGFINKASVYRLHNDYTCSRAHELDYLIFNDDRFREK